MIVTEERASSFAKAWIDAWNSHNLDRILEHYADDIVFYSPFIVKVLGDERGQINGKAALHSYFAKGLAAYPDLRFELHTVLSGIDGLTIYYTSINGRLVTETILFNQSGDIATVHAHYNHI
jgi:ketosteroid isomerase-like protein